MPIDADDIPVIVDLFADSDWEDLEVTSGEVHLVLSKRPWGGSALPLPSAAGAGTCCDGQGTEAGRGSTASGLFRRGGAP
jgi:hypothetical protein